MTPSIQKEHTVTLAATSSFHSPQSSTDDDDDGGGDGDDVEFDGSIVINEDGRTDGRR